MNLQQFITEIEAYYGAYPKGQRKYIDSYLRQRYYDDEALTHLFSLALQKCSSRYGKAPDIEAFEGLYFEVLDKLAEAKPDLSAKAIEDKSEYVPFSLSMWEQKMKDKAAV